MGWTRITTCLPSSRESNCLTAAASDDASTSTTRPSNWCWPCVPSPGTWERYVRFVSDYEQCGVHTGHGGMTHMHTRTKLQSGAVAHAAFLPGLPALSLHVSWSKHPRPIEPHSYTGSTWCQTSSCITYQLPRHLALAGAPPSTAHEQ